MNSFQIRPITVEQARPIRHKVLRPHQDFSQTLYPFDDHELSFHAGVVYQNQVIGVSSIYPQDQSEQFSQTHWRVRGMALLPEYQKQGLGQQALKLCLKHAQSNGAQIIWCNARTTAAPFYQKMGFVPEGPEFVIEGIGPHYVLVLKV